MAGEWALNLVRTSATETVWEAKRDKENEGNEHPWYEICAREWGNEK